MMVILVLSVYATNVFMLRIWATKDNNNTHRPFFGGSFFNEFNKLVRNNNITTVVTWPDCRNARKRRVTSHIVYIPT